MKISVEELTKGLRKFLEYYLFEPLDETTICALESQIGNILESKDVDLKEYKLRSTPLDSSTLKINLQFFAENAYDIDFYLARASYE